MARRLAAIVLMEPALNANLLAAKESTYRWMRMRRKSETWRGKKKNILTIYVFGAYKFITKFLRETEMKRVWAKLILSVSGILALVGMNASSGQANIQFNKQIAEVRQTTPVYLKLGGDLLSKYEKGKSEIKLTEHYSHQSHYSHRSHYSSRY